MQRFSFLFFLLLVVSLCTNAQRVGLVLSGGGARGMAHIGVIKALEENHIPIDYIAGTSAGAIVGCMYALGFTPDQMDSIVRSDEFFNWANGIIDDDYTYYFRKKDPDASWINLKFNLDSIISTSLPTNIVSSVPYDYALMENTAAACAKANYNFDSLFVPFRCVAADIENKKTEVFRGGDLGQAVRASSAYPFYFKPIFFDNKILYDGGMYNNFPADVMLDDFQPDIIIGVNAAGSITPTSENNIISQIRAMMTTPTNFSVICDNGILIEANTDRFGLFDFSRVEDIIAEGYRAAYSQMERIKTNIPRRVDKFEFDKRRKAFRDSLPPVVIDNISIEGINNKQADYVRQIIKPGISPVPLKRLKASYYELVADPNVRSIYPSLKYDSASGYFNMKVRLQREKDLITKFGGVISSRPVSEAFFGAEYDLWSKQSYNFSGNFYFGKLYTSGQLKVRMDSPARFPFFIEADATLNQYDFFKSSNDNTFFTEKKPTYILQSDYNFGFNIGIPIRNKSKLVLSPSFIRISDSYYQTQNFIQQDTADQTILHGPTVALTFERSTLNLKEYANQGTFLSMKVRYFQGEEFSIPGSTSIDRADIEANHRWVQFHLMYDNYFKSHGRIRFGFYSELALSGMGFLNNYTSTTLNSPTFEPIQESQTLYIPTFHAFDFAGIGSKNVVMIRNNFDLRVEGYLFQPYQELIKTQDLKTALGTPFNKRYYIASVGAVFHSPLGPISLFVNYFDNQTNSFSVIFHFGYFIFNQSALN